MDLQIPSNWKILVSEDTINTALANLCSHIKRDFAEILVIIGILNGAAYFLVDLSRGLRKFGFSHQVNFVRVSSYKDCQTAVDKSEITGLSNDELYALKDKHVLLVDELYDTGRTLHDVITYLDHFHPRSIRTCVMFRKNKPNIKYDLPQYCGIDNLPDVWYVGYGLDDLGTKRELTTLYAVPKAEGLSQTPDDRLFENEELFNQILSRVKVIEN